MQPRILFLVMSAVSKPGTVDQLANALAPHTVLVHHDFSQTPDFSLTATNVQFVPDPRRTGWAYFGFVDGIFHSLRHALSNLQFDYLQLLSPTCLPIKPIAQFEARVTSGADAHFDCVNLLNDRDALMSVGYRAFTPELSLRHLVARRATNVYFGTSPGRRDEAGIWLRTGGGAGLPARMAGLLIQALSRPAIGRHIFGEAFHPYYGTPWFGARRDIIGGMVRLFEQPGVRDYFSRLRIAEEFLFPTMLMQLVENRGPMNHVVKRYVDAHTGCFEDGDIDMLRDCGAYFARKFPDDPAAPIRLRVLEDLVGAPSLAYPADATNLLRDKTHAPPVFGLRGSWPSPGTGAVSG
ncbi:hypothetical protein GCM10027034_45520 [Ramlibacter solisilvae]|uniref:Uncharacterized protein n=1 Tax=Ramlibacter tataouinensis TaxID=94132 RepID=A0A127JSP1_9BURK|nr:hypothetical protein [Ramlibacter tataouinensis]AMO23018.1 hypothetical protein UC35_09120 [Ramlibacter tataouinensis]